MNVSCRGQVLALDKHGLNLSDLFRVGSQTSREGAGNNEYFCYASLFTCLSFRNIFSSGPNCTIIACPYFWPPEDKFHQCLPFFTKLPVVALVFVITPQFLDITTSAASPQPITDKTVWLKFLFLSSHAHRICTVIYIIKNHPNKHKTSIKPNI